MVSNLDSASELFLADVGRIQQNIAQASRQVSSGKKIAEPSDAPDEIAPLLQLRADLAHNTQIQSNLVLAQADANSADSALGSAIQLMDSAQTLASQGTDVSLSATDRRSLAGQVQSLQQQMVALSNTGVQGRYIFSGDQDQTAAYQIIPITNPPTDDPLGNGVTQISMSAATRQVEDPAGGSFSASRTAQEIFDTRNDDGTCAAGNVFASLNALRLALENSPDGDSSAIQSAIGNLKQASVHLNAEEAFYGNVQTRIQDSQTYAGNRDTQLQTQASQIEDADVASAALELTQANTQLSAAFQARAQMPTKTLFDYLG